MASWIDLYTPGDSALVILARQYRSQAQEAASEAGAARDTAVSARNTVVEKAQEVAGARGEVQGNLALVEAARDTVVSRADEVAINRGLVAADRENAAGSAAAALASRLAAAASEAAVLGQTGLAQSLLLGAQSALALAGSFSTLAAATAAIASYGEGQSIEVTADPSSPLNGMYAKQAGAWVQTGAYTVRELFTRIATLEAMMPQLREADPARRLPYFDENGRTISWVDPKGWVFGGLALTGVPREAERIPIVRDEIGRAALWAYRDGRIGAGDVEANSVSVIPDPAGRDFDYAPLVRDAHGAALLSYHGKTGKLAFDPSDDLRDRLAQSLAVPASQIPGVALGLPEAHGGQLVAPNLCRFLARTPAGVPSAYLMRMDDKNAAVLEVLDGLLHYWRGIGQSLVVGGGSNDVVAEGGSPIVTTPAPRPHQALMLNTGVIGGSGAVLNPDLITGLRPAVEVTSESGLVSAARWVLAAMQAEGRAPINICVRTDGAGGRPLSSLGPGTEIWNNGIKSLRRARALATQQGLKLYPSIVFGNHGQSEGSNTVAGYKAEFLNFVDQMAAYTSAEMGETVPMLVAMDALAAGNAGNPTPACLGQIQAAEERAGSIFIVCCYHWFNNLQVGGLPKFGLVDDVHLYPLGYALRSEYWAKWWFRTVYKGLPWTGIRPAGPIELTGLSFRVPLYKQDGLPLTFDTVSVPQAPNFGLRITPVGGAPSMSGLNIDNNSSDAVAYLQGTLSANTPSGSSLAYALFGSGGAISGRPYAWGNIRNTRTEQSIAIPGLALHDWAPPFTLPFPV